MIKTSSGKHGEDDFNMTDFNLLKLRLVDAAIASLSIKMIKEVLIFIQLSMNKYYATYMHSPNYNELRDFLRPQSLFR